MSSRRSPALLTTMVLLVSAAPALAQERGFRLHRYDGTSAGSWQFLVERPWYSGLRFGAVGVTADFSRNALVPRLATGRGDVTPIIENALLGHVDLAGSLFDRVVLSGSLPITFLETGRTEAVSQVGPLQGVGVGDPRVGAMVRVAGQADVDPFSLHLGADLWIPVGTASTHQGDTGFRLRPRVVMAGAFGVARWSFEGGFLFRQYASYGPPGLGMTAASEAQGGVALGVSLFNDSLFIGPESQFAMQVVGENALSLNGMNLEVLGGAHLLIADTLLLGVAGGTAFLGASGTPDLRAIARLSWAPRKRSTVTPVEPPPIDETACPENTRRTPAGCVSGDGRLMMAGPAGPGGDSDGDGIPDGADRCPFEPETKNGIRDLDGCPESAMEPDAALARVLAPPVSRARPVDAGVAAPAGASRLDAGVTATPAVRLDAGVAAASAPAVRADGGVTPRTDVVVPVAPIFAAADSDGDGVPDDADRCPVQQEDLDGFEDEDGCPELDNDDDGIADAVDQCPSEAETANGFEDEDGCPDVAPDADKDGIADVADRCPFEPETFDGVRDDDGCPEFQAADHVALSRILSATPANVLTPSTSTGAVPVVAPPLDSDGDGVDDAADRCPVTKEDLDGFEDEDGCPEPDNDGDGVPDVKDQCPLDAETINGTKDDDGCPDEVSDVDGDGIGYDDDRCPLEPGNSDDGCPHLPLPELALAGFFELSPATPAPKNAPPATDAVKPAAGDLDKDGISDETDRCPLSAEDVDGFEDEDGCPEPDNDQDGIPDAKDKCPFEAETINGKNDTDGCPDVGVGAVTIREDKVVINGVIGFKTASATLQPAALPLLKQVASTLLAAATLSLEIQGHTDDVGNAAGNIRLSKRRAEAIRAVLVKNGVNAKRLIATGFGPTRPRATNKTAAGREQNRRVEFLILGEAK
ncbi:MAG: OmpA family protein [Myxococcales bacterium]|nr:OmpA family protein [Myxococcales bacterium]